MKDIICMNWGSADRAEYVNRLYRTVARQVAGLFRFVCRTPLGTIAKVIWFDSQVIWRYGSPFPDCVRPPESDHPIYVNPADYRARVQLIRASVRRRVPRNQMFWRRAVKVLQPEVAVDVGLNYGECFFSCEYPPDARLIGIEANSDLKPYVSRSHRAHPNRDQMEIHFALASDVHQEVTDFYVMEQWSGGSTALASNAAVLTAEFMKVRVQSVQVDELLRTTLTPEQTLLFKIDVEGFEPVVMRGMAKSIDQAKSAIGLIEFDTALLDASDNSAAAFWNSLQNQFRVFVFASQKLLVDVSARSLDETKSLLGLSTFHTDALVVRGESSPEIEQFLEFWLPPVSAGLRQRDAA